MQALALFRRRSAVRAWVALAASYAFALQLLLTGIVVTQMTVAAAAADPFAICAADPNSQDTSHRSNDPHAAHQACAICTFASSAPLLPAAGHRIARAMEAAAAFHPAAVAVAVARGRHNPRSSQGPPRNV
jgi:hypothetical protein